VLSYLAKGLEEVATKASQSKVDAELIDAEKAQAGLDQLTGKMQIFTGNAAALGAQAGKAFVAAFQAELNVEVGGPSINGVSPENVSRRLRRDLDKRGGK